MRQRRRLHPSGRCGELRLHRLLASSSRYWPSDGVFLLLVRLRAIMTPSTSTQMRARPPRASTYGLMPAGRISLELFEAAEAMGGAAPGCSTVPGCSPATDPRVACADVAWPPVDS